MIFGPTVGGATYTYSIDKRTEREGVRERERDEYLRK